jgi:TPR repeat protein
VDKEQNESSAIEWLQNSAARGGVHAQFYLGSLYEKGQIVVKDKTKAFQLYEKAAKQGHGYAQFKLGYMYHKGKGVEKNESTAVAWFQKAADQGHAEAQLKLKALGSLLANKTVSLYKNASVGQTVFGCAET